MSTVPAPSTVSAVVLNYDGRELLQVILPSLARQSYGAIETIVVDNGSHDDSVEWLRREWPQVELVAIPENIGVTPALNVCLRAGKGEFVALFNNDMELDRDCVAELVRALQQHPDASCAAAKLLDFYERGVLDGAGDMFTWGGEALRRGKGERDAGQYDEPRAVFGACGGAALYRRSVIEDVGLLDEALFANYEDVDWSFRAQLAGYECRFVPSAIAYHMEARRSAPARAISTSTRTGATPSGSWPRTTPSRTSCCMRPRSGTCSCETS